MIAMTIEAHEAAIAAAATDLEKAQTRTALAWELRNADLPRAKRLAQEALSFCQPQKSVPLDADVSTAYARGLLVLGWIDKNLADYSAAIASMDEALLFFIEADDEPSIAHALNALGAVYSRMSDYKKSIDFYARALEVYEKLSSESGCAIALNNLGTEYYTTGDYLNALRCLQRCRDLREKLGDNTGLILTLNNLGNLYFFLSDYPEATRFYHESLRLSQGTEHKIAEATAYSNLGNVSHQTGDYRQALEFNYKSLALEEKIGDPVRVAGSLSNIGTALQLTGDYRAALDYQSRSLSIRQSANDLYGQSTCLDNIGSLHYDLGDYEKAVEHHQKSIAMKQHIGDKHGEALALTHLGKAQFAKQQHPQACASLTASLDICKEINLLKERIEPLGLLAQLSEKEGNFKEALEFYRQFHEVKNKVFSDESDKTLKNLQVRFDVEQTKKQAEVERIKNTELAQALAEAEKQRTIAEDANRIKSEILNVVAHDLQTPMSSVINFIYLLKQSQGLSPKETDMLTRIESVSQAMLRQTVNLLNAASERHSSDLRRETVEITALLRDAALHCGAERKQQTVSFTADRDLFVDGDADKLCEVFENLLSNAVKYSARGGKIEVAVKTVTDAPPKVLICVQDDGLGMSAEDLEKLFGKFQRLSAKPTAGESSTGLGLYITRQLVELHSGKVWAESAGLGHGTTFFVELLALAK